MNEQTKQKIIETAKKWVDDTFNINGVRSEYYSNKKLRTSVYFVEQLKYYIGELAFNCNDDYTIADESEIVNAVLA